MMNLNDPDKLNLVHICLRGNAHIWYRQNRKKFLSWSQFINEICQAFTSNLQRDLAFDKLKNYRQSTHQWVTQYYNTMIKLTKQADPRMNDTTRVQHLMNGLRLSLMTETRRNYPRTPDEFLVQAKIAEELTRINNMITTNPSNNDDLEIITTPPFESFQNHTHPNKSQHHPSSTNSNNFQLNAIASTDDRQHYSNRISNASAVASWKNNNRSRHLYNHSKQDARYSNEKERQAATGLSTRGPCYQSSNCLTRDCQHFDERNE